MVALAAALAGDVMVKFFGVIFLGQPREARLREAHDAGWLERSAFVWLAACCVFLGLGPTQVVSLLAVVPAQLGVHDAAAASADWWRLTPVAGRNASYAPSTFLAAIAGVVLLTIAIVGGFYHRRIRRSAPWDCGFVRLDARMQDTAEGFGQPIRHIFEPFFSLRRKLPSPFDRTPHYQVSIGDRFWIGAYLPLARGVERLAQLVGWLQQGRISNYLLVGFVTLLALLALVL